MPLRRWFTTHGMPAWWSWVVLVVFTAGNIGLTFTVTNRLSRRAIEADRTARAEAAEQSRGVVCGLIVKQEAVFRSFDTENSKVAADAWHDLGITYGCYKE